MNIIIAIIATVIFTALLLRIQEMTGDITRLERKLDEAELGLWQLRLILAGKGYGVLTRKVIDDEATMSCSYYSDRSSQEFCTQFYSKDNKDENNI